MINLKLPLYSNAVVKPDNAVDSVLVKNYWIAREIPDHTIYICKSCGARVEVPRHGDIYETANRITSLHPEHPAELYGVH